MIFSSQLGKLDGYTNEQAVKAVANHLRKVQEELEYRLSVLDSSNITEIDTNITKMSGPLVEIVSEAEDSVAALTFTSRAISAKVGNLETGHNALAEMTASSFTTAFGNEVYNVASYFQQEASKITAKVQGEMAQMESSFSIQMNAISGVVSDLQTGQSASLTLNSSGVIVRANGTSTTINGGNIYVDTLYGSKIYLKDSSGNAGAVFTLSDASSTYAPKVSVGCAAFSVDTTGYSGSIYLHSGTGANLLLGSGSLGQTAICKLSGAPFVIDSNSFGNALPTGHTAGQVFFLTG